MSAPDTQASTWPSDELHANLAAEEYVEEAFERAAEERGLSHWRDFTDAELIEMAAWFGAQSRRDEVAAHEAAAEQRGADKALNAAADELWRLLMLGYIRCSEITEDEAADHDANAPRDVENVPSWLRARAAAVADTTEGSAR